MSPHDYLVLHNAKPIVHPLIEHPEIGPQHFARIAGDDDVAAFQSVDISSQMRALDKQAGYDAPKVREMERQAEVGLERNRYSESKYCQDQ